MDLDKDKLNKVVDAVMRMVNTDAEDNELYQLEDILDTIRQYYKDSRLEAFITQYNSVMTFEVTDPQSL